MAREIHNWHTDVSGEDFYVLPGGNVYMEDYGYITDPQLINPDNRRDNAIHWDKIFKDSVAFQESWKPRPGPLELVYNLSRQNNEQGIGRQPYKILNMGAGLGDFSVDLARLPGVQVTHVDFSEQANSVARKRAKQYDVLDRSMQIVTAENRAFLTRMIAEGQTADMVFYYGGLGENTPLEEDIEASIVLGSKVLGEGGYLWYVGLQNEFLNRPENRSKANMDRFHQVFPSGGGFPTDILGEFPPRPGLIRSAIESIPGMYIVKEENGPRPDKHPLKPGGISEDHIHDAHRLLAAKRIKGVDVATPDFGFKDAANPKDWEVIWEKLTS